MKLNYSPYLISFSFFDDYIQLVLKQELSLNKYEYSNFNSTRYEDGTYIESNSSVSLGTDLIKPYENYLHTVNFSVDYNKADSIREDGNLYFDNTSPSDLDAFAVTKSADSINFGINQSLYDSEDLKQIINHKLTQSVSYDEYDNPKLQNLENEIYIIIFSSVKIWLVIINEDKN